MGYLLNGSGLIQFSGTISDAQFNTLGSNPFIFNTPINFVPFSFGITVLSGTVKPIFSSRLAVFCPSNLRVYLLMADTSGPGVYNFAGITAGSSGPPDYFALNEVINVEPQFINNVALAPADLSDPTPGDFSYKYNLTGFILV